MFISSAITVVVIFGSPNSLNKRNDNSRIRSRVRRGALRCMAVYFAAGLGRDVLAATILGVAFFAAGLTTDFLTVAGFGFFGLDAAVLALAAILGATAGAAFFLPDSVATCLLNFSTR